MGIDEINVANIMQIAIVRAIVAGFIQGHNTWLQHHFPIRPTKYTKI